ncbi:MAG: DUF2764 family protein [Bacteroidales bacterium]|nr:DUF2764 family protein [Bacteroidales bacterium]MDD4670154.1 DUF2764 family protein [Bacteroidales bacterium]
MDNYPYIIAGLPDLLLNGDGTTRINYDEIKESIVQSCSPEDNRLIEWFEFGTDSSNLSPHFYRAAASVSNLFISSYFIFDKNVRDAKVAYLTNTEFDGEFEEYPRLKSVFQIENIIDRELQIDKLYWSKAGEIVLYELFNINVILAFLAKAKIVDRWNKLDRTMGAELFRTLVQEVRGTFKGVEYDK